MAQHKYQQIVEDIRNDVRSGALRPGCKVPAVSDLRSRYGVSHITALRVFRELQESGLIENRPGQGYFVAPETKRSGRTGVIGLFIRPLWGYRPDDTYFNEIHYGIQQECAVRHMNWFQPYGTAPINGIVPMLDGESASELMRSMLECADKVDGFLVDERVPDDQIAWFQARCAKPLVLVNRQTQLPIDSVGPEQRQNMRKLSELAMRIGYKRFACVREERPSQNSLDSYRIFEETLLQSGVAKEQIIWIDHCNLGPYEETHAELDSLYDPAQNTLVCSACSAALRRFADLGAHDKFGLVSFVNLGHVYNMAPQIAAFVNNPVEIGRLAVRSLSRHFNGLYAEPRHATPESELFFGETL